MPGNGSKSARRSCMLCGEVFRQSSLRIVSVNKQQNAVLVTLLLVSHSFEAEFLKNIYNKVIGVKKYVCHCHHVDAAKYLAAEMLAVGSRFSYYNDPSATGSTAYVNEADIPLHVVDLLNLSMREIDETISVTERDVCQFLNDALRRYYSGSGWNSRYAMPVSEMVQPKEEIEYNTLEGRVGEAGVSGVVMKQNFDLTDALRQETTYSEKMNSTAGSAKRVEEEPGYVVFREPKMECEEISEFESTMNAQQPAENAGRLIYSGDSCTSESASYSMNRQHQIASHSATQSHDAAPQLDETDPALLKQYFLIEGEMLMKLFRFCPECGEKLARSRLCPVGTAAVMRYVCSSCPARTPNGKRWESQPRAVEHGKEKILQGNLNAVVAAVTTGIRYMELRRFAEQLNLSLFSRSFFLRVFEWTKTAVDQVYQSHQKSLMEVVRSAYEGDEGLAVAADITESTRRRSMPVDFAVLSDCRTKLILHTESIVRQECDKIRETCAVEGLTNLLRWMSEQRLPLSSIVTSRSRRIAEVLRSMEPELGPVRHLYHASHFVEWLEQHLKKAAKEGECSSILPWIERLKAHLHRCVEFDSKSGSEVPHLFNKCLSVVKDGPSGEATASRVNCSTGRVEVVRARPLEGAAFRSLRSVVLNKRFQRDLTRSTASGGVSVRRFENVLDRIYLRSNADRICLYPMYMKMCVLHLNTLRLVELAKGRRRLKGAKSTRPHSAQKSAENHKSPMVHEWRDSVLQAVVAIRLRILENDPDDLDGHSLDVLGLTDGEEACNVQGGLAQ